MPRQKLAAALGELHDDLTAAHQVDEVTKEKLKTVLEDIQRILDENESPERETVDPVQSDLNSLMLKLETEHPTTSGLLNRIAQALADLGI